MSSRKMSLISQILKFNLERSTKWDKVVNQAEKVVGYPTSYLNLRWLLSDEFANVALHIKKLVGTKHPLIKTAKNLVLCKNIPTWGLVVLLVSKVAGFKFDFPLVERDVSSGVLFKQRALAEITEMLRASNLIHKGILNVPKENISDLMFGNKMALLSGDYLLSTSFRELSNLRNQKITEMMSAALRDLTQCEFLGSTDIECKPIPSRPNKVQEAIEIVDPEDADPYVVDGVLGNMEAEWTLRNILQGASLLSKACSCSLMLSGHSKPKQYIAYSFGKHLALSWQAQFDLQQFYNKFEEKVSLISAPIMYHLLYEPSLFDEFIDGIDNIDLIDYKAIRERVNAGPAIQHTEQLQSFHSKKAIEYLYKFPESDARTALKNIVVAIKDIE